MRDGGQLDLRQRRQFDADRARGKPELIRDSHQTLQRGAGHRHREPLTQRIQIDVMTVITRDHREARKTALRRFRCYNDRKGATPEFELPENVHARRPTA